LTDRQGASAGEPLDPGRAKKHKIFARPGIGRAGHILTRCKGFALSLRLKKMRSHFMR
jgi:hypothetical protein